ncbi:MAG: hypothetical protein INR71_11415 [Terriglobus roseus]|nr:hypothetical protein [Terriglobus roseus]
MPPDNLHMTAIEITHSRTQPEIDELVEQMKPHLPELVNYTRKSLHLLSTQPLTQTGAESHHPRLHSPLISYDAQGLALSFLPAAGASPAAPHTYHHLRRDLHARLTAAGVPVGSRYVVPSAHLTVARFVESSDFEDGAGRVDAAKMARFVGVLEDVNAWLEGEFWPREGREGLVWTVGEEKGLDCREGKLWYGGGRTVLVGEGI